MRSTLCERVTKSPYAKVPLLTKKLLDDLRDHQDMPVDAMINLVKRRFNIVPSRLQMYRVKKAAKEIFDGKHDESFGKIP